MPTFIEFSGKKGFIYMLNLRFYGVGKMTGSFKGFEVLRVCDLYFLKNSLLIKKIKFLSKNLSWNFYQNQSIAVKSAIPKRPSL